jgi:hypothetical protein
VSQQKRETIPAAVKRAVRQRCGFGCVFCGSPAYQYEHIEGYGTTGHDPDEMTLLCTFHHNEKTLKRLPVAAVRRADKNPHNRVKPLGAKHPTYFEGPALNVDLGSFRFIGSTDMSETTILEVDGEPILKVRFEEDGIISLDLTIRDSDNRPVLIIRRGELRHTTTTWDVEFLGQKLTVRRGLGDIILSLRFATPDTIVIERAEIWASGILIRIGKSCIEPDGGVEVANNGGAGLHGGVAQGFRTMLAIGDYLGLEGAAQTMPVSRRWLGGQPAPRGSFSRRGGGQTRPYTDPAYLASCTPPSLVSSYLAPAVWGINR